MIYVSDKILTIHYGPKNVSIDHYVDRNKLVLLYKIQYFVTASFTTTRSIVFAK